MIAGAPVGDGGDTGAGRGAGNLARLREAFARLLEAGPAERVGGRVNRQWLGREAGVDPQCLRRGRNPGCADAFEKYEADDAERWLAVADVRKLEAERKAAARKEDDRNEDLILELRAENARLKSELEQFRALRRLMADTGRMP